MNVCPQCSKAYDDENIYCLDDGNALIIDGFEVETVINQKFGFTFQPDPVEATHTCGACGNPNKASSRFCKKCGKAVGDQGGQFGFAGQPGTSGHSAPAPTITFQPPNSGPFSGAVTQTSSNRNVVIGALAAAAVFVLALLYIVSSSSSSVSPPNSVAGNSTNSSGEPRKTPPIPDGVERIYTGLIGAKNMDIKMTLKRDKNLLSGRADTVGSWDTLLGSIEDNGSFQLNGNEFNKRLTGVYTGQIHDDGTITGIWNDQVGKKQPSKFSLK